MPDDAITSALAAADDDRARELAVDPGIGEELRTAASVEGAVAAPDVIGGTAPRRVAAALAAARERLDDASYNLG
jgi:argininosuccinate lyase